MTDKVRNNAATRSGGFCPPISFLTGHFLVETEMGGRFKAKKNRNQIGDWRRYSNFWHLFC